MDASRSDSSEISLRSMQVARGGNSAPKTARQIQQELGEIFGARGVIPWDLYNKDDKGYLFRKIGLLIPDAEGNDSKTQKENLKLEKARDTLVSAAWNQRKYYGGNLLMAIVYVACTPPAVKTTDAQYKTKYSLFPILRIRKCCKGDDSSNCCMIFVDDNGRVYQDWRDYVENNNLPEGVMVAPHKGYYDFTQNNQVILDCEVTPASTILKKTGDVVNVAAGIIGIGAAGVSIAAIALPVAAPLLIGAAIAGIGSGICSAVSSVVRLVDRGTHEECIDLTDSQARADYLGIVGGVVGVGASGATTALARYAATGGNVSRLATGAVNTLNVATIVVNGVAAGNSGIDMIVKLLNDEEVSAMDFVQLGASLFLVTHSVYNFKTASQIVRTSRDQTIQGNRKQLSNRQRKAFDRAYRETIRLKGPDQGKADVIRALDKMPDSKQPLNDLHKINKQLNENGLKASFARDGKILLNNDLAVDSGVLRQNLQHGIGDSIPDRVGPAPSSYPAENLNHTSLPSSQEPNFGIGRPTLEQVMRATGLIASVVMAAIGDAEKLDDCVNNILTYVTKNALDVLCRIANEYLLKFAGNIQQVLRRFIPFEEILWNTFQTVLIESGCIKEASESPKYLERLDKFIMDLKDPSVILKKIEELYRSLVPRLGPTNACSKCGGIFTLCDI